MVVFMFNCNLLGHGMTKNWHTIIWWLLRWSPSVGIMWLSPLRWHLYDYKTYNFECSSWTATRCIQLIPIELDFSLNSSKVPFWESQFTRQSYLQCLHAAVSGMQDQLQSTRMKYRNLKKYLPKSHLNNIFQISNKIWHICPVNVSFLCLNSLFQDGSASSVQSVHLRTLTV